MSKFYTNVDRRGNKILYRYIENGKRLSKKVDDFMPTMYVPSKEDYEWKTLYGTNVKPVVLDSISDARKYQDNYDTLENVEVYGQRTWQYQYISQEFPYNQGNIDFNPESLVVSNIDIETTCENGFPDPWECIEEINAITLENKKDKTKYVFTNNEFEQKEVDLSSYDNLVHIRCENEKELLTQFVTQFSIICPDIITGWNIDLFDIPYLVNRITKICGESCVKRLSPFGYINLKSRKGQFGKEVQYYQIVGIAALDYYRLYDKFTYVKRESMKLDHIGYCEVGEKKVDYSVYGSLHELYKKDYQKFIEYNIKDVVLVSKIDDKLQLIKLVIAIAYLARVNFEDVFSPVKTWESYIYHYLNSKNVVIPNKSRTFKNSQYVGAYVKQPNPGMYEWIASFDLASLYPSIMIMFNISPETYVEDVTPYNENTVEHIEIYDDVIRAANGACYDRKNEGVIPVLVQTVLKQRKADKKRMMDAKQKYEQTKNIEYKKESETYHTMQLAKKVMANSLYGMIGNQYSAYYSVKNAEAITLTGQVAIKYISNHLEEHLQKIQKSDKEYNIYNDTDSAYFCLKPLVEKYGLDKPKNSITDFVDRLCQEVIQPVINKKYQEFSDYVNAPENKLIMDRECIGDKAIWTAKKRYIIRNLDDEGVRLETPKLKVMGIETKKSSTPEFCRKKLEEAIDLIFSTDEDTVIKFIENTRKEFFNLNPEDVAFPRGCNGLEKYSSNSDIYIKGTPIHTKGGLIYNHHLKKNKLEKKYKLIANGDKIKYTYLMEPNRMFESVISFPETLPKEFKIHEHINYKKQYEKAFIEPLRAILNAIGWKTEKVSNLGDLL